MKNKTKNKLARNTVRVRKKQRAQEGEKTKKKPNKRLLVRVGSIVACMLLVGVLAIPAFADTATDAGVDVRRMFDDIYLADYANEPALRELMDSVYYVEGSQPMLYQFDIPSAGAVVAQDEPLTFNDINTANSSVAVYEVATDTTIFLQSGHWQTQYTTSGANRTLFFKYYEYNGEVFTEVLSIRVKYDYSSRVITESSVSSNGYSINGNSGAYTIACATSVNESAVLEYGRSMRLIDFDIAVDYDNFTKTLMGSKDLYYNYGYNKGYTDGDDDGYDRGYTVGYQEGVEAGVGGSQSAEQAFMSLLDPRADNLALSRMLGWYNGFGDNRFFKIKTLVTGEMDINNTTKDFSFLQAQWSSNDGLFRSQIPIDSFFCFAFSNGEQYNAEVPAYEASLTNGYVQLALQKGDSYDNGYLSVKFYREGNYSNSVVTLYYNLTYSSSSISGVLKYVYFGNTQVLPEELYDVSISFVPTDLSENIPLGMFVNSVFASQYSAHVYTNFVYSPLDFYTGYSSSYQLGYDDGERYGYNSGKQDGFEEGQSQENIQRLEQIAFEKGKREGLQDNTAYQQGYNLAVSEIESGDFGRNLIGATLNTPLEALANFNIVSWTTANGGTINISIMTILSGIIGLCLFVWFLRMFAGG